MVKKVVAIEKLQVPSTTARVAFFLSLVILYSSLLYGLQPQTNNVSNTQPLYSANATHVDNVAPGNWSTAESGLTSTLSAGAALCGSPTAEVFYGRGTLTLTASATNWVYLDPANKCSPASNNTGFPVGAIPNSEVVTSSGSVTAITDTRTSAADPNTQGPAIGADQQPGADCGAKINAADAALGGNAGEIWVNQDCGTSWTTAVAVSANHVLKFVQGGTYSISSTITLSGNAAQITGEPQPRGGGGTVVASPVLLKEAPGANLPAVVKVTGAYASISYVTVDGNQANQTCPSPPCYGVWVLNAPRAGFLHVTVQNCYTRNIQLESNRWTGDGRPDRSAVAQINDVMVLAAKVGSGMQVLNTGDVFISDSEFENNGAAGLELVNAAVRVSHSDFGGNQTNGFLSTCTDSKSPGAGSVIVGNQFGNNHQDDLFINGWTGETRCASSLQNVISSNQFVSSGSRPANAFDAIKLSDSGFNVVVGNAIDNPNSTSSFKTAVEFLYPNATPLRDQFTGNSLEGWATSGCTLATTTNSIGNTNCKSQVLQGSLSVLNGNVGIRTTNPQVALDVNGPARTDPVTFSSLPACSSTLEGSMQAVTDSTTSAWGATITGGGSNHVLAYCDGTNWMVAGK